MKNNKKIIATAFLSLALVLGASTFTALAADDTVAKIGEHFGRPFGKDKPELTDEQRQTMEAERETKMAEMETKRQAVENAINANDYQAWANAIGSDSPLLENVNADNFAIFVEAHQLMAEARTKLESLGIAGNIDGLGQGHGSDRGHRVMMINK